MSAGSAKLEKIAMKDRTFLVVRDTFNEGTPTLTMMKAQTLDQLAVLMDFCETKTWNDAVAASEDGESVLVVHELVDDKEGGRIVDILVY